MITLKPRLAAAVLAMSAAALLGACGKPGDTVTQAAKKETAAGVPAPGIAEVKAIAEEGFVYGLPLVMNYGVMYEYILDKNSGQWKAPFNSIYNEHRVFTYEDTAIPTPNSDTPYSLAWLDLRSEPIVISVPAVDPKRYYAVMLNDGNTWFQPAYGANGVHYVVVAAP